jgi:predicted MPP superfamily phosphohydrolase
MRIRRAVAATALAGAATLGYALAEAHWFTLRRIGAQVLPAGAPPVRVLQVSDMHVTAQQRRKVEWVRRLAGLEPDLVVVTGDNFAFADAMEAALEALEPLLRFPGAFVLGSNDYYSAAFKNPFVYLRRRGPRRVPTGLRRAPDLPTDAFRGVLTRAGWRDLDNARASLALGEAGLRVDLVGLADPHVGYDRMPPPADHAGAALVLGLVHAPYRAAVRALVEDSARLVLAGHTHGGQVALPGVGALVSNTDLPLRYASGLHSWPSAGLGPPGEAADAARPAFLYVSRGLGTSPFAPVRLAARPEAVILTLTAA